MRAYATRRIILLIPTLFITALTVFFLVRLIPGDIIDLMATEQEYHTEMDRQAIRRSLGLDVTIYTQFGRWLGVVSYPETGFSGILQGSLGNSLWRKTPVIEEILQRLPVTFELGLMAILVAQLVALPIGIYSAIRQDTAGDYAGRSFAILALAVPGFWVGTMVMVMPAMWWGWSPPVQLIPITEDLMGNLGMFIVPAVIMGMQMSGTTMRMTRTMMLEVLRQDYIRTAWSKGLKERVVIMRHALKNALIPVITIIGFQLPLLLGGAVITEQIFTLPGIGLLMLDAINNRDYPIVSGVMLMMASFILTMNLIVDLSYGFLDPRVKFK